VEQPHILFNTWLSPVAVDHVSRMLAAVAVAE
jgi:hypothetical protein